MWATTTERVPVRGASNLGERELCGTCLCLKLCQHLTEVKFSLENIFDWQSVRLRQLSYRPGRSILCEECVVSANSMLHLCRITLRLNERFGFLWSEGTQRVDGAPIFQGVSLRQPSRRCVRHAWYVADENLAPA